MLDSHQELTRMIKDAVQARSASKRNGRRADDQCSKSVSLERLLHQLHKAEGECSTHKILDSADEKGKQGAGQSTMSISINKSVSFQALC